MGIPGGSAQVGCSGAAVLVHPLPHQDQKEHGLHTLPGFVPLPGEQAGREMGRGSEVGQTGLQRGVHEQEYT